MCNNLGNLLSDIEVEFAMSFDLLRPYLDVFEVRDFLERREQDLSQFKSLTYNCKMSESVVSIKVYLRDINAPAKIYGGICSRGAEYFKIPKKVLEKIRSREAEEAVCENIEEELHFDKDYCIPDELGTKEFAIIYS